MTSIDENERMPIDREEKTNQSLAFIASLRASPLSFLCTHACSRPCSLTLCNEHEKNRPSKTKTGLGRGCRLPPRRAGPPPGRGLRVCSPLEARARRRARGRRGGGEAARARGREHAQVSGRERRRKREKEKKRQSSRRGAAESFFQTSSTPQLKNDSSTKKNTQAHPRPPAL